MDFKVAAYTDIGLRKKTNQDSLFVKIAETDYGKVLFAVVCDGMGGLAKGEVASTSLVKTFERWFEEEFPLMLYRGIDNQSLMTSWGRQIQDVKERIERYSSEHHVQMGTTIVALLIVGNRYYVLNIGDSRAYLIDRELIQLTHDQTFVQREVDMGRMTPEQAHTDPRRSVLLQCVGASEYVRPDFFTGDVGTDCMFLLCSDGFRHEITPYELAMYLNPAYLTDEESMKQSAVYLVELNKSRMENDNISVLLVRTCEG